MPRIRSIKPEYFTSVPIANLSRDARLLFVGLWTHVDDDGRCVDDPRLIKAAIFPLDDDLPAVEVDRLLDELSTKGRLLRYEASSRRYMKVIGFDEHQKIDRRTSSKLPPPPSTGCSSSTQRGLDEDSSPDLDRIGSDRIGSSSSRTERDLTEDADEQTDDDDDGFVDAVVQHLASRRTQHARPRNPIAYKIRVIEDVNANHRDAIRAQHRKWPNLDPWALAEHYETRPELHLGDSA